MTGSSWNPPTGPPNGAPVSVDDARSEIESAITAARNLDGELRGQVVAVATERVRATDRLPFAVDEIDDARSLAKRALVQSDDAARAGQRDEAAKCTAAAQVFAMRARDARAEAEALEAQVSATNERIARLERACAENVGRLEAVAAARLPVLRGRKAARAQDAVDATVAELRQPLDDAVAGAMRIASEAAAAEADRAEVVVADEDLEKEVDFAGVDEILAELRDELGLLAPHPRGGDAPPVEQGRAGEAGPSAENGSAAEAGPSTGGADAGGGTGDDLPRSGDAPTPSGLGDGPSDRAPGSGERGADGRGSERSAVDVDHSREGRTSRPAAGAPRSARGADLSRGRSWPVPTSGR